MHSILHSCVFPEGMDEHLPGGIHKVIETRKNFPRGAVIFFSDWYKNDKEEITEQYSISYRKWPKPRKRRTCDILFLTWSVLIKENKSCNIRSTYKISNSKLKQIKNYAGQLIFDTRPFHLSTLMLLSIDVAVYEMKIVKISIFLEYLRKKPCHFQSDCSRGTR